MTEDKTTHSQTAAFIWSVADLLRGNFRQSQYGRIILPFTILRRLECVLAPTKDKVLDATKEHQTKPDAVREKLLLRASGHDFFNASPLALATLSDSQAAEDLMSYVQSFSKDAREIFEYFHFEEFVQQLSADDLLYQVVQRFASFDLRPTRISNFGMGIIFEEMIRKFAESSNETAREHFTARDIVHLATPSSRPDKKGSRAPSPTQSVWPTYWSPLNERLSSFHSKRSSPLLWPCIYRSNWWIVTQTTTTASVNTPRRTTNTFYR